MEYKEIKLYAPCDCIILDYKVLDNESITEKIINITIQPKSKYVYSPFTTANMVYGTNGENSLCFLDELNNFWSLETNSSFKPSALTLFKKSKVKPRNKLAIIESNSNNNSLIIKWSTRLVSNDVEIASITKNKIIKQGESIGQIKYMVLERESILKANKTLRVKYHDLCSQLYEYVGTKDNYTDIKNCMTRLRFTIKDKSKVNSESIKKLDLVKGINWAGDELQIIIGPEVYKVFDDFMTYAKNIDNIDSNQEDKIVPKKTFKQKAFNFISSILVPNIPILMAAGILMAIQSLLVQLKAIEQVDLNIKALTDYSILTGIIYILSQTVFSLMGVFICYNTTKYFGGNPLVGIAIGLMLASSFLIGSNQKYLSWTLFKINDQDINVQAYTSAIIPQMMAGMIYGYLDRWIKTWMPSNIDVIFRPTIAVLITVTSILLLFGPFLLIIEKYIVLAINWVGKTPYGIGTAVLALLWQPLVITGMHLGVVIPLLLVLVQGHPSSLLPAIGIAVWAQVGAVLGIFINSKNPKVKQVAGGALWAGVFGITEPAIYGVNLPRIKPFLIGCLSAGIIGLIAGGLLDVKAYVPGGLGIFAVIGMVPGGVKNVSFYVLGSLASITLATSLVFIFCKESKSEKQLVSQANKILLNMCKASPSWESINNNQIINEINHMRNLLKKEDVMIFNQYQHLLIKLNKLQIKVKQYQTKYEVLVNKYQRKYNKINTNSKKVEIETKIMNSRVLKQKQILEYKLAKLNLAYEELQHIIRSKQESYLNDLIKVLRNIAITVNDIKINDLYNLYYNAIYQTDIAFNIIDLKPINMNYKVNIFDKLFRRGEINAK